MRRSIFRRRIKGIPNLNGVRTWIRENRKYREGSDIARKERSKDKYRGKRDRGYLEGSPDRG